MNMLAGGVAALFGELMEPVFLPATLTRPAGADTYEAGRLRKAAPIPVPCRAQVERATERMVATEGYTATDRSIYILAASLEGGVDTGCKIEILEGPYAGSVYRLASPIDRDPAAAYWLCRGVEEKQAPGG